MSTPFIGEIRMFGFNFAPKNWAFCQGQLMPISQNTALFSIIGTFYGGNGTSNFGLPNLQGSIPIHQGQGPGLSPYVLGEVVGTATVTLIAGELPSHGHPAGCSSADGDSLTPGGNVPAKDALGGNNLFTTTQNATMNPAALGVTGGGQPHNNLQPFQVLNYCIALFGVFPSRN
jgi:microcystin-dependent protein